MLQASHASSKLRELNNDTLCIDNVFNILITIDGDVFFELLPVDNLDGHFGQLQGMDRKYNEHSWCKVKAMNINNNFAKHGA
jgi:hypothetical protein